jgi:hypothetical protein
VARLNQIVTATYPLMDGAEVFERLVENRAEDVKAVLTNAV